MAKNEKKVSISSLDKVLKEQRPEKIVDTWHDIEVTVKPSISFTETLEFANDVVMSCFSDENGFVPEVMDFAIKSNILSKYANFSLPDNLEHRHEIIYNTDAVQFVCQRINMEQLREITASIDRKIAYLCNSNTVTASEELWDAFYQTILGRNVTVGNSVDTEIANAWIRAAQAVNEYSSSVNGLSVGGTIITSVPKYHDGGVVDEANLGKDEALAILQKGEVVLNEGKQQVLYRIIDFQAELAKRLGDVLGSVNIPSISTDANSLIGDTAHSIVGGSQSLVFEPHIEVAISHNGAMSDTDAESYGDKIANTTIDKLYSAFERRGINSTRGSRLKP